MNILIPMAGDSRRFNDVGYTLPKPLIDVDGKPMIQRVIENLPIKGNYIFIVRKDHEEKHQITKLLKEITKNNKCEVIVIDDKTEGQAATVLKAKEFINNEEPLLIVNSDNYFLWDIDDFINKSSQDYDGMIFTFIDNSGNSNWSYAKIGKDNKVEKVVEKVPISNNALAGAFFWKNGKEFVRCAEQMIKKNIRTNNQFYVGPVFNEAIEEGKTVYNYKLFEVKSMAGPDELSEFLEWVELKKMDLKINDLLLNYNRYEKEMRMIRLNKMKNVIENIKNGKPVIVVDDYDRENEGDIVIAAEKANVDNLNFAMKYARGLMCIPITGDIALKLNLPAMTVNTDRNQTPFTVSVDAREETTTGMSVYDRLKTLSVILNENSKPDDLTRPGHLFPLRARDGLLTERRGHTEGSIELIKLAELKPVAVIVEIMNDDGTMAKGETLDRFAIKNGLSIISIEEIYETAYNKGI